MGLCQAVAVAKKALGIVCNRYQVCVVIQNSSSAKKDVVVVCNGYQVCGVFLSSSRAKKDHLLVFYSRY